jgi:hypothetical protein
MPTPLLSLAWTFLAATNIHKVCEMFRISGNPLPPPDAQVPSNANDILSDYGSEGPHRIHPKWTVCLAAPKVGCTSRSVTGELYMGDLGVPRACWKRTGVKGGGMPWGADFLVALEYV